MAVFNRTEVRIVANETVFIVPYSSAPGSDMPTQVVICDTVDFSANGLCTHIDEPLPIGGIFPLFVELHATGETLQLTAEVKWTLPMLTGHGFKVGLALLDSDETDIVKWKTHIADTLSAMADD
jgi:Tfp pilus assembly protein PilZ